MSRRQPTPCSPKEKSSHNPHTPQPLSKHRYAPPYHLPPLPSPTATISYPPSPSLPLPLPLPLAKPPSSSPSPSPPSTVPAPPPAVPPPTPPNTIGLNSLYRHPHVPAPTATTLDPPTLTHHAKFPGTSPVYTVATTACTACSDSAKSSTSLERPTMRTIAAALQHQLVSTNNRVGGGRKKQT